MFDFPATVAALEDVPEEFRGLYSREGDQGDFKVNPAIGALSTSIANLNTTNRTIRGERDAARKITAAMTKGGFETWEDVQTRIAELETQANQKAGAEEQVARVKADLEATHARQKQESDGIIQSLRTTLEEQIIGRASLEAINEEKGKPKLLNPIVRQRLRMVEEDGKFRVQVIGDDGQPMLDGNGGELTIKGYVNKLKADPDYGDAFEPTGNNGTGSNPNGHKGGPTGDNPFKAETRNLTKQQELIQTNPDRARALAQAAGVAVNW